MRSLTSLVVFVLVASLILASAAVAQEEIVGEQYEEQLEEKGVPPMAAEAAGEQYEQQLEVLESPAEEKVEEPAEEKIEQQMEKGEPAEKIEQQMEKVEQVAEKAEKAEKAIPKTGGPVLGSLLLPAAVLLVGSGVLAFAVLRRR